MQNSQWLLITPLRRNTPNHGNPITYRYPSPGSVYQENQALDYKTAFQQTHYNVRYAEPTINQRSEGRSSFTSFNDGINPVRRLVLLKLLKESDVDNQAIVKEAKAKFKAAYGFDIDQPHVADDLRLNLPKKTDREGIREFQQQNIIFESIVQRQNLNSTIQKIQKPNILQFESFDLYDAPHFKQNRVQLQYKLDQIKKLRAQDGVDGLITRQGSANYWKPLDDYNDPKNVKRVQSAIGDPEPTNFTRNIAKVKFQFDKDGNVVDIHRIKQKSNE